MSNAGESSTHMSAVSSGISTNSRSNVFFTILSGDGAAGLYGPRWKDYDIVLAGYAFAGVLVAAAARSFKPVETVVEGENVGMCRGRAVTRIALRTACCLHICNEVSTMYEMYKPTKLEQQCTITAPRS